MVILLRSDPAIVTKLPGSHLCPELLLGKSVPPVLPWDCISRPRTGCRLRVCLVRYCWQCYQAPLLQWYELVCVGVCFQNSWVQRCSWHPSNAWGGGSQGSARDTELQIRAKNSIVFSDKKSPLICLFDKLSSSSSLSPVRSLLTLPHLGNPSRSTSQGAASPAEVGPPIPCTTQAQWCEDTQ